MTPSFDTKAALVIEESLSTWQKVNVAAFLFSGFGAVGEHYRDADGNEYLPMLREPIMVFGADGAGVRRAYERARARGVEELAIFTRELFDTPNDEANRAAVAAVPADELDLVGVALRADRKTVDRILDKARPLSD
jgi:hypothetical protein